MSIMLEDREVVAHAKGGVEIFRGMLSDFPSHVIAAAAAYAIHKKCQDASGGADVTESKAKELAVAVVASLKAGTWAKRGGGARATTYGAWLVKQAEADAKRLTKAGAKYAGKDAAKVAEALAKSEPWVAAKRKLWDEIQARKAASPDLDLDLD